MENIFILLIALILDIGFGELPNSWHPVAWLGKVISVEMTWAPEKGRFGQLVYGAGMVLVTVALFTSPVYFLLFYLRQISLVAYVLIAALLLKLTFSLRELRRAAVKVKELVAQGALNQARYQLQTLVSRDTTNLDKRQVVSATIESVAENSCDSFVAPLFYFLFLGVPGAIAYRIVNTFDAMIGYRGNWEHIGKFAARLDDVVNFVPARLTGLMIVVAAFVCKQSTSGAWQIMLRDHAKTESPNAGWTMSAAAGALGVQLEKPGHYKLGDNHYCLLPETIDTSLKIMVIVAAIWSLICISAEGVHFVLAA